MSQYLGEGGDKLALQATRPDIAKITQVIVYIEGEAMRGNVMTDMYTHRTNLLSRSPDARMLRDSITDNAPGEQ